MSLKHFARTAGVSAIALLAITGSALADGYGDSSAKDAPAAEGRKLEWSITLGATSDYVFRGLSLTDERPAAQGSIDMSYGIFYAGAWASNLDDSTGLGPYELDLYAGIKPELGRVKLDLGLIGYLYPAEEFDDPVFGNEGNAHYLELKAGASIEPFKDATAGVTVYYSPEYQFDLGDALAVEGTAGYTLRQIGPFVPTISGTFGWQYVEGDDFSDLDGTPLSADDDYLYWNVGVALAVDKFTIDLRYWDTDIEDDSGEGLADERFVGSVKVTLP